MSKLVVAAILGILGWLAYDKYQSHSLQNAANFELMKFAEPVVYSEPPQEFGASSYSCDGRIHCSQMTSCAEATFFLRSCPGVKMDGDNDGVACEQQWCN